MSIIDFLNENVYTLSIALFLIGLFLKQTPKIPNWSIPYILSVLGVIACNIIMGIGMESTIQGIIVTGVAVYVHQLGKQGSEFFNLSKTINSK
ncbi:MAG: hypothetical protein RUMPE_01083 [Eubacteriales bacterium SKADARSKE-1]|nr:hypothetical protein [Eubacteriales bacterium SKADARSKE-1]